MGVMNIFASVHASAQEHGNEHDLPGAEVRHVSFFKEVTEAIILENSLIKAFRSSLNSLTSADQFGNCLGQLKEALGRVITNPGL